MNGVLAWEWQAADEDWQQTGVARWCRWETLIQVEDAPAPISDGLFIQTLSNVRSAGVTPGILDA